MALAFPAPSPVAEDLRAMMEQVGEAPQGEERVSTDNGSLTKGEDMDILSQVENFMETQASKTARLIGVSDEGVDKDLKFTLLLIKWKREDAKCGSICVPIFTAFTVTTISEKFITAPTSTSSSSYSVPPPHHDSSNQQQWQKPMIEEDDVWGDFVESSLQPQPFSSTYLPPLSPPSSSSSNLFPGFPATVPDLAPTCLAPLVVPDGGWQKPSGALPLSLFGEEAKEDKVGEESSMISTLKVEMLTSFKSTRSTSAVSLQGEGLKDLINSLYGQADKVDSDTSGDGIGSGDNLKVPRVNGMNSDIANGDPDSQDEFNESCWEFHGALSSSHVEDSSDCVLVEKERELAGISGVEGKATCNISGSQHSDDCTLKGNGKKFNMFGSNLPSTVLKDEGEWGNAFVSHGTAINGSDVRSVENGCNGSISNAYHNVEHVNIENRLSPNVISGDTSLDDSFWEFKDASSNIKTISYVTEPESIVHTRINELESLHTSTCSNGSQDFGDSFPIAEGHQYEHNLTVNGSENVEACSAVGLHTLVLNICNEPCNISTSKQSTLSWQDSAVSNETLKGADDIDLKHAGSGTEIVEDKNILCENMDNLEFYPETKRIVDFYSRLKQKSYTLALHHIENIKRANEVELPGEEPKPGYLDGEIKAAFSKLGILATESDHLEKSPNGLTVYDLLEVLQNPCFQAFDMEYSLSAKIQLAAKDLTSAMWLFEHASYILRILRMASYEEQRTYIISWSKLVVACEKELQHGAVIWSKAHHANIQKELLSESQGQQYFLALGEIYRIIEILSVSARLYKAWILLNPADSSVFLTCIKKSLEAWKGSALKHTLEIISESLGELKVVTEELLESLTFISELCTETLQSHLPNHGTHFCGLSLLPLELLPDIKHLVWQGDHYFSKLANLWANRISCDVPQLPHIHVGQ
ncbi:hypothetical protein Taro_042311 [Colocasia esculenta]|uniref:Synergin gamma C-terminal domain-containing protein n=1 Tax=Colocasia esculenta TaxID=4460 RepID=A0A843WDN2_COLES|nr:hypothetical protein [Colocasia esculenta]